MKIAYQIGAILVDMAMQAHLHARLLEPGHECVALYLFVACYGVMPHGKP